MLDYKLVEAFAEVIEEGGFEKAARRLHITQSAVSQRIKQLEDQYGQVLLQRTSPPQPTLSGLSLLSHYRRVRHLEEDLFSTRTTGTTGGFISLALGINADTLATWFFEAVHPFLREEKVVLDLHIDDQDRTHKLLQEGKVLGCITTRNLPIQGCRTVPLGTMRYSLFCTPDFAKVWFPDGLSLRAAATAPILRFNRKDGLNDRMFELIFASVPQDLPTFFVPSPEMFAEFIRQGCCYGVLPEQQSRPLLAESAIVDLAPAHTVRVDLYWHCWNLRSAVLENFSQRLANEAKRLLAPQSAAD